VVTIVAGPRHLDTETSGWLSALMFSLPTTHSASFPHAKAFAQIALHRLK
jgi:hypothetical protein